MYAIRSYYGGVIFTGQKFAGSAPLDNQFSVTELALYSCGDSLLFDRFHILLGSRKGLLKRTVKALQKIYPIAFTLFNLVQIFLHGCGKLNIHYMGEMGHQQIIDQFSQVSRSYNFV